jgi:hypothetical protein
VVPVAGSTFAVVDGAGGVALSTCWARAAIDHMPTIAMPTIATASIRTSGRQTHLCAVSLFIALPQTGLQTRNRQSS